MSLNSYKRYKTLEKKYDDYKASLVDFVTPHHHLRAWDLHVIKYYMAGLG